MIKQIILSVDRFFGKILGGLLVFLINSIVILMVVQILLRYVFRMPMKSIEELLLLPVLFLYFLGSINATKTEQHISARLLEVFCKNEKQVAFLRFIASSVGVLVVMWLIYISYDLLKYSIRMQKVSMVLQYPLIIIEALPVITFFIMFIYCLAESYRYFSIAFLNRNGKEV